MDPGGGANTNSYIPTISQSFQPNNNQVSPFQYYDQSNQPNFSQPPNQGVNGGTSTNANNPQIFSPGYAGQGNYLQPSSQPYNANRFPSPQQGIEQQSVANQAFQQNFQLPGQVSYLGVQATHHPQVYRQPTRFLPFQQSNVVSIQPQPQINSNQGPPPEIDRRKLHSDIDCMITWACMNIFIFGLLFGLAAYIEAKSAREKEDREQIQEAKAAVDCSLAWNIIATVFGVILIIICIVAGCVSSSSTSTTSYYY